MKFMYGIVIVLLLGVIYVSCPCMKLHDSVETSNLLKGEWKDSEGNSLIFDENNSITAVGSAHNLGIELDDAVDPDSKELLVEFENFVGNSKRFGGNYTLYPDSTSDGVTITFEWKYADGNPFSESFGNVSSTGYIFYEKIFRRKYVIDYDNDFFEKCNNIN